MSILTQNELDCFDKAIVAKCLPRSGHETTFEEGASQLALA